MPTRLVVAAAVVLASIWSVRAAGAPEDAKGWDPAAAARYLDARMDVWWTKAKTLRTGTGDAKCVSCHTAVPYAMARPMLRIAMGSADPTPHEDRILETVRQRVRHAGDQAPFYDHTEAKKLESRGVEAVLNAFLLTRYDTLGRSSRPSADTQTAMRRLWEVQRADGAWDWLDFGLEPYETIDAVYYGASLAAMAAGTPAGRAASADAPGHAGMTRLRDYLRGQLATQRRFNTVWALLAAEAVPDVMTADQRAAIVRDLESAQHADGGWSLADLGGWRWSKTATSTAPGKVDPALLAASDGYATGLVVYALKRVPNGRSSLAVTKGLAWLRAQQQPFRPDDAAWAPWRAHSLNFDREHGGEKGEAWRRMFMSDMATAFAVLALQ